MIWEKVEEVKNVVSDLVPKNGACKFCGQMYVLEVPEDWGGCILDEYATEKCKCDLARRYQRKKRIVEKATSDIENMVKDEPVTEELEALMKETVEHLANEDLTRATFEYGPHLKIKITRTSKGTVKVERIKTEKKTEEAI